MALSDLFAPAWIYGNQQSMDAANAWNAAHLRTRPKQAALHDADAARIARRRAAQRDHECDAWWQRYSRADWRLGRYRHDAFDARLRAVTVGTR